MFQIVNRNNLNKNNLVFLKKKYFVKVETTSLTYKGKSYFILWKNDLKKFLAITHGLWDLISLTRDQNCAPYTGSMEC